MSELGEVPKVIGCLSSAGQPGAGCPYVLALCSTPRSPVSRRHCQPNVRFWPIPACHKGLLSTKAALRVGQLTARSGR
jgi:hypothetical protein